MARFMVVDDSKVIVKSLAKMLEDLGHEVVGMAYDGLEAILLYEECTPDIVTMDINMPKLDGQKASLSILKKNPHAKIIIISSVDNPEVRHQAVDTSGVIDYLVKPVDKDKLQGIIKKIL